jgi:hypothetical protein
MLFFFIEERKMSSWPTPADVMPVVHDDSTSMSLHFRSVLKLMDNPTVCITARRKLTLEIAETLLVNTHIKYPPMFIRNLIKKFEDANDILTFDRTAYINSLWMLI